MGRSGRSLYLLALIWIALSCAEDEVQTQFYGYQIERLLSEGDTAIWRPIVISGESLGLEDCEDSVRLMISHLYNNLQDRLDDSLEISQLVPLCDNGSGFDTVALGRAKASAEEGLFFTDSIRFADGRYWIITEAFSLTFGFQEGEVNYRYEKVE